MIIGVCGKSGSGKSTLDKKIVELFGEKAIFVDIDEIGHNSLTVPDVKNKIAEFFGGDLVENDIVNRKKLSRIVFDSKEQMDKLTEITWGYMESEIDKIVNENRDKVIVLDWQLLPKTKFFSMCDCRILLDIPYEVRKQRILQRDNITEEGFELREKASYDYDKESFDIVLDNN